MDYRELVRVVSIMGCLPAHLSTDTLAVARPSLSDGTLFLVAALFRDQGCGSLAIGGHVLCRNLDKLDPPTSWRDPKSFLQVLLKQGCVPLVLCHTNLNRQGMDRQSIRRLERSAIQHACAVLQVDND